MNEWRPGYLGASAGCRRYTYYIIVYKTSANFKIKVLKPEMGCAPLVARGVSFAVRTILLCAAFQSRLVQRTHDRLSCICSGLPRPHHHPFEPLLHVIPKPMTPCVVVCCGFANFENIELKMTRNTSMQRRQHTCIPCVACACRYLWVPMPLPTWVCVCVCVCVCVNVYSLCSLLISLSLPLHLPSFPLPNFFLNLFFIPSCTTGDIECVVSFC
jgi:hypothetical protein